MKLRDWLGEHSFRLTGNTVVDELLLTVCDPETELIADVMDVRLDEDDYIKEWRLTFLTNEHLVSVLLKPEVVRDIKPKRYALEVDKFPLHHVARITQSLQVNLNSASPIREHRCTLVFTPESGLPTFEFPPPEVRIDSDARAEYAKLGQVLLRRVP